MTATAISFMAFGATVLYGGLFTTIMINVKSDKN